MCVQSSLAFYDPRFLRPSLFTTKFSKARLELTKTTRNFLKTTSLPTRRKIGQNDQFPDQFLQNFSKRPVFLTKRPRIFYPQIFFFEKNSVFFCHFLIELAIFPLFFQRFCQKLKTTRIRVPGRLRPGRIFADQATSKNDQESRKRPGLATLCFIFEKEKSRLRDFLFLQLGAKEFSQRWSDAFSNCSRTRTSSDYLKTVLKS